MAYYDNNPGNRRKKRHDDGPWEEEGSRYSRPGRRGRDGAASADGERSDRNDRSGRRDYNGAGEHNPNRNISRSGISRGVKPLRNAPAKRFGPKPVPGRCPPMDQAEEKPAYMDHEYVAPPRGDARPEPRGTEGHRPERPEAPENVLAGRNPIREALRSGRDIEKLLVMRGELSGSARQIVQMAREARVPVQEVDKERLDEITPHHQGLLAFASAYQYSSLEEMLQEAEEKGEDPFLIILDGITDPQNLGAVIRTAECVGAHGVIVRERRSVGLTPAAVKASAGAVEYVKVARVTNLSRVLEELKKRGVWVYAVTMDGEDYQKVAFSGGTALVIGSEGEGISRLILEHCDQRVSLPMRGKLDSLNASAAASVMMYRVLSAREK